MIDANGLAAAATATAAADAADQTAGATKTDETSAVRSVTPDDIPASIRLRAALVGAHAAMERALERDAAACHVLGPEAIDVLLPLAEAPARRLRLGDLAERSGLTPSGLTRRIDALVAGGLVVRVGCPSDRRGTYAELTDAGLRALPGALAHHAGVLDRAIGERLDSASIARLTELLEMLAAS